MTKMYRILIPLLAVWLAGWMYLSWAAIQDDALIHLRYADNLFLHHFITYDGVHSDYGASSLLYVALLALLRNLTVSPDLPRAVSSVVHGILFAGLAYAFAFRMPRLARTARLAGLLTLVMLVTPSAVRWLDDGMETGVAVLLVSLLTWLIHGDVVLAGAEDGRFSWGRYLAMAALAFFSVLLRTELVLMCGCGFLILMCGRRTNSFLQSVTRGSHLLIGAGFALAVIRVTMHVLLPDTAIAKSHGLSHWFNPIHDTAVTLGGAFSFGIGMLGLWLLTLLLAVLHRGRLNVSTALANAAFPVVLALASLRGQEIQGVRYFAWTFFFPVIWNILELAPPFEARPGTKWRDSRSALLLGAFVLLLAVDMPFEARAMYRVLSQRSEIMRSFKAQHLDLLRGRRGVASDIGYIGYFSGAQICDLAGLVNGRAAARLSSMERSQACAQTSPDFLFGNVSQLASLRGIDGFSSWQVCGRYNFPNVRTLDTHYLVVRPALTGEVCRATELQPEPVTHLFGTTL